MQPFALAAPGLLAVLLTGVSGCAAGPPPPRAPAPAAPLAPDARDEADMVAQEAVDARVTMSLHIDRIAHHRFARYLVQLGGWEQAMAGTGVDPLRDVQRAFIAAHTSHLGQVAIVLQHTADDARVTEALADLQRSFRATYTPASLPAPMDALARPDALDPRGARPDPLKARIARLSARFPDPSLYPFPAAYRVVDTERSDARRPVLIAAPHPGLLVVLPPERVFAAFRMMEVAGLPPPTSGESLVFRAWDPQRSIQSGPLWSRDVRYAEAVLSFDEAGDGVLRFRAVCTTPEAARAQARIMTAQVERAQALALGGAGLRLFDEIQFRAENDRVKMHTRLLATDLDWLVAMTLSPP